MHFVPDADGSGDALPSRTQIYVGIRTDSRRWDAYAPRGGDIIVCTPPKCGTTWTQAICALLLFKNEEFGGRLADISPWVDGNTVSLEVCLDTLANQEHRRFMKTHTPLDGIPYLSEVTYLAVYRDPRDAYFSMRSHLANVAHAKPIPQSDADPNVGFAAWLDAPFEPGVADQRSLEFFVHHYSSFRRFADLANIHFFHYADLKSDLLANMQRLNEVLGTGVGTMQLTKLAEAASFDNMQSNPATFAPAFGKGIWKDDTKFFSKGKNRQWEGVVRADLLARYEEKMARLAAAADKAWLENGSSHGSRPA